MSDGESGSGTAKSGRTGRRPGNADTRLAILDAARVRFAGTGFDKTSIRAIAADADVDPALVHHYFGNKQQLFAAAVDFPVDPDTTLLAVDAAPLDELGQTIVRAVVTVWDSPPDLASSPWCAVFSRAAIRISHARSCSRWCWNGSACASRPRLTTDAPESRWPRPRWWGC